LDTTPERRAEELAEDLDENGEPAMPRRQRAGLLSHVAKRVALVLVALLVLPYLLIPVYALPFTRPVSTLMLSELFLLRGYDRRWVDLDEISPNLVRAVMMSEDGQFCSHNGVDWRQMRGVVQGTMDGEATRGASTISMQTAKNLFLWNGRFFVRKILELPLAIAADTLWSKRRMMEIYLNVAEWGPGIYGIEAASQHYFKTSAARLSTSQASLLAVALPNPFTRVASKPGRGMRRLAAIIDRRARNSGEYIKCIYE